MAPLSYDLSNLSLIALETIQLLAQTESETELGKRFAKLNWEGTI